MKTYSYYKKKPDPMVTPLENNDRKIRSCLMCNQPFLSVGPENRRCDHCEEKLNHNISVGRSIGKSGRGHRIAPHVSRYDP